MNGFGLILFVLIGIYYTRLRLYGMAVTLYGKALMSKGSRRRPCDEKAVAKNWPFKDRKPKQWPRDKKGNLK
jgi:hypothetical protein